MLARMQTEISADEAQAIAAVEANKQAELRNLLLMVLHRASRVWMVTETATAAWS